MGVHPTRQPTKPLTVNTLQPPHLFSLMPSLAKNLLTWLCSRIRIISKSMWCLNMTARAWIELSQDAVIFQMNQIQCMCEDVYFPCIFLGRSCFGNCDTFGVGCGLWPCRQVKGT